MSLHSMPIAAGSVTALYLLVLLPQFMQATPHSPDGAKVKFPAAFAFGDSILDTGNNNVLPTLTRCDFLPYGKDFAGHKPTGRFSNGKVPSDLIASVLGIKELLPPYLTTTENDELLTGVCFASGGTGYDPLTVQAALVLSMSDQLDLFREYKKKVVAIAGEQRANWIISNSLYVVCGGSNDVINSYFGATPIRRVQYNVSSYMSFLARSASSFVQDLYKLGARNVGVVGLPPLGCVPLQRTLAGDPRRGCSLQTNQAALHFNKELAVQLQRLQKDLQGTKIVYIDIYTSLLDFIQRPSAYGFQEVSKGCCGTGLIEMSFLCNSLSLYTCPNDSEYMFWDSVHPTQKAYEILVGQVKDKYLPLLQ